MWVRPNAKLVRQFLTHPAYAGLYAYGMTESWPDLGKGKTGYAVRRPVPRERWIVVRNHHPLT